MTYIDPEQRRAARHLAGAIADLGTYLGYGYGLARDTELAPVGDDGRAQRVVLLRHLLAETSKRLAELEAALPTDPIAAWPANLPTRDMRDVRYPEGWPSDGPRVR